MPSADDTYTVKAQCSNCAWGGFATIVKSYGVSQVCCPRCGQQTLDRVLLLWPWQVFNRKRAFRG